MIPGGETEEFMVSSPLRVKPFRHNITHGWNSGAEMMYYMLDADRSGRTV
jgi:hypothetical protein